MEDKVETIILKDGDVLQNQNYGNKEFDTLIKVVGDNVVIDNIFVYSPKTDFHRVIEVNGKNCVIKNCRFQDFSTNGPIIVVEHDEEPDNCIIHDCLFYGGLKTDKNNGLECIRLGESKTSLKGEGNNIIFHNRFENMSREIEIISVKNNNNLIVNNEVINCKGTITLRHGKGSLVAYNLIDGKNKKDSGGIRVVDNNHSVIGNILLNIQGDGLRSAISLMCGIKNSPLNRYLPIQKCYLINNTLFNCKNGIAFGMSKKEANVKPEEVYLQGTTFVKCENINSLHKDHVGADKVLQALNRVDETGKLELEYPLKPVEFKLDTLLNMKQTIIEVSNKQILKLKESMEKLKPIPEENGDLVITDDDDEPRIVDIDLFMDKLIKKLRILERTKKFETIQQKMAENVAEHKKLMAEMKELMK